MYRAMCRLLPNEEGQVATEMCTLFNFCQPQMCTHHNDISAKERSCKVDSLELRAVIRSAHYHNFPPWVKNENTVYNTATSPGDKNIPRHRHGVTEPGQKP